MTTTRSDSDECLAQNPLTSRNGFSQDSLKVVTFPPLEKDSVAEMISSKKRVKPSPLDSLLEKYEETSRSDSLETSFSKEPEAMDVDCLGVFSVPQTTSVFLEEDRIGDELQEIKETSVANISEFSTEGDQIGDDAHKMEADVSVVCISDVKESLNFEKKGQEDSDVQRLLEAEKRRLLAEVETGTILRKKDDVGRVNGSKEQPQKVERVRVKDNAFVGRSVNIDLVDDTALLNVVPFSKKAKDHPKRPGRVHSDKDAPRKPKKNTIVGGKQLRIMYSINQMKSMRYAHIENQKKLWSDMYARLLPELVAEYESLVSLRNHKTSKSSIGPVSAVPRRNRVNIFVH